MLTTAILEAITRACWPWDDDKPASDVLWREQGIDSELWADPPPPYSAPAPETADASSKPAQAGETS